MYIYTGWWCNNHLEKYESQLEKDYPIYGQYNRCSKPPTSMYIYIFDYQRASVFLASSIQSWHIWAVFHLSGKDFAEQWIDV